MPSPTEKTTPAAKPKDFTTDTHVGGVTVFKGIYKMAVVNTTQDRGIVKDGRAVHRPLKREEWTIHFTAPMLPIADIEGVLACLPTEEEVRNSVPKLE